MRYNHLVIFSSFIFIAFFNRCTSKSFPSSVLTDPNLPASINNGKLESTSIETNNSNDREYFLAVHRAVNDLKGIISKHKIIEPRPTISDRGDNKIDQLFRYISIFDNELTRLKTQPKSIVQQKVSQIEAQLHSKIKELEATLKERDQEIAKLNNEVKMLSEKSKTLLPLVDTLSKQQTYLCTIKLKNNHTPVKSIQVKENSITFNFKVEKEDVFSTHEPKSYSIEHYGKNTSCLIIRDSELFWQKTKELLVWGTNEKNICVNGDTRIRK